MKRKKPRIKLSRSREGEQGCLCPDENIYRVECCDPDNIWGQRVGNSYGES